MIYTFGLLDPPPGVDGYLSLNYYLVKVHMQFFSFFCVFRVELLVSNVFLLCSSSFFFLFFSFQVFDIAKMTINHKKDLSRFRHKQEIKKIEKPNMNIPYLWEPTIQDWHDFYFFYFFQNLEISSHSNNEL
jgi:hypothetical protein